jgi:diaminopimelate decarboxylase
MTLTTIREGKLFFDGVSLGELARDYGTPLYVISEGVILDRIAEIRKVFLDRYPGTSAVYASKAFQTLDMVRLVKSEGLGLDVVSGGEIFAALKAGFDPGKMIFHGNSKTVLELEYAIENGVGRIVADNLHEIDQIENIVTRFETEGKLPKGSRVGVLYRVTPGVDSHTHRFISTGSLDSKFGIPLDKSVRAEYMRAVLDSHHIDFRGFHFHIGSQLLENTSHLAALGIVLDLIVDVGKEYGYRARELNLGGGFGIRYLPSDSVPELDRFIEPMMRLIRSRTEEAGIQAPAVTIEPGRWIIGEAGLTLYTLGAVKEIPGIRTYVGVDGGMGDNIRPALYDAKYHAMIVDKADRKPNCIVTMAGKSCETGDILIKNIELPNPEPGDILAVFSTGAYNHSMASNYNRNPRPAVVIVHDGEHRLSVRRETWEDLISREL